MTMGVLSTNRKYRVKRANGFAVVVEGVGRRNQLVREEPCGNWKGSQTLFLR